MYDVKVIVNDEPNSSPIKLTKILDEFKMGPIMNMPQ